MVNGGINGDLAARLRQAVDEVGPSVRADLELLVAIPSVSAAGVDTPALWASAEAVAELLRGAGCQLVDVVTGGGSRPAVIGHRPGPAGAPTVLLYAHHDVQPTGDHELWSTDPFSPQERGGRLYGRGAADDKAGIAVYLCALRAFDLISEPIPVSVSVFIEGEEEIGSPALAAFLTEHGHRLRADVVVLADAVNWAIGVPALTTTLRGIVDCTVSLRTLDHPVHSGMFGGPAPDALTAMCRLLATLHDEQGEVAIGGLLPAGLTWQEADPLDMDEARFRVESGLLDGTHLLGSGSVTSRLWTKPAVTVLAIDGPRVGEAANVLQAAVRATVSMRVPAGIDGQHAMAALTAHLQSHAPWGAEVSVEAGDTGEATKIATDGPAFAAARRAFAAAWGTKPAIVGVGGSIPFIGILQRALPQAEFLVTGVEDPDSRAHGADESLHLGEFARACLAHTLLLAELGERD